MNRPRLTILINARSTRYDGTLGDSLDALEAKFSVRVVEVDDPAEFAHFIREAARDSDVVAIASGDGTLARSAGVLMEIDRPIGLIPLGNANDLARGLGIPLEVEAACLALCDAEPVEIDVGRVGEDHFFSAATLGIGAQISAEMEPSSKRRWRRLSQVPRLISAIRARRAFELRVLVEGRDVQRFRSLHITIGNGRTIGGGIVIDEAAKLDDAVLKLSSVQPQNLMQLAFLIPAYVMGKRRAHPRIDTLRARRFRIETSRPLEIATDGDVVAETPADFECIARAVRFLVPRAPASEVALQAGLSDSP